MAVMSKEETALISASWDLVATDIPGNGCKFFVYLFDKHPKVRETYFNGMLKSSNDIKGTLEKHGTKVINALGAMVSALKTEDDAKLLAKISEIVNNHWKRGIQDIPPYQLVVDTLLEFLAAALGSHLTPAGGAAWKKLLDTFVAVVGQEQEKIRKDQKQCSSCSIN